MHETENVENSFEWDHQTKYIFSLLRVLFSFLWIIFLRDQYKAATWRFGRVIRDDSDFVPGKQELGEAVISSVSQLYQFSDVLYCKDELHSAAIASIAEIRPTEDICRRLARLFYNSQLVTNHNQEKLKRLHDHLDKYDSTGNMIHESGSTKSCLELFTSRIEELRKRDVHFHSIGQNSESFISFFSKTKFKLYEKSEEYLNFIGGQGKLYFVIIVASGRSYTK